MVGILAHVCVGEMDVVRVKAYRSGQGEPPVTMIWFVPHWPAAVTQFQRGGDSKSASYPLNEVHLAWVTYGVGGWIVTFGEDKKTNWCVTPDLVSSERGFSGKKSYATRSCGRQRGRIQLLAASSFGHVNLANIGGGGG